MESPQPVLQTTTKRSQTPWIIAAVSIVLCCCCVVLAIAGYAFRINRIRGIPQPPVEDVVPIPVTPDSSQSPTLESSDIGEAPEGGLGNDILRNDTWAYVASSAQGQGCDQPMGADSTIEVLQQPQNGIWVEKWIVACASGESYAYEIQFTLDAAGTKFDIKPLP